MGTMGEFVQKKKAEAAASLESKKPGIAALFDLLDFMIEEDVALAKFSRGGDLLRKVLLRFGVQGDAIPQAFHSRPMTLVEICAQTKREQLRVELAAASFVAVLLDESTDEGCEKILSIYLRWHRPGVGPKTTFLELVPVADSSSDALFGEVKRVLLAWGVWEKVVAGLSKDAASQRRW